MPVAEAVATESIAQSMLAEFEAQAPVTRRFLERLPEDKLTWKPHEKSMTAGQLALHIALVPGRLLPFVQNNPAQAPEFGKYPQPASRAEILKAHDESVTAMRTLLPKFGDAAMNETWRMMAGEREVFAQPRKKFLHDIMFSHVYQHRGQFSVYLRMLNVAVPASWGPSADELPPHLK
jgi:uncharacterized damage-inducible protein DinB